jgi:hypothetical protein
LPPPVPGLMGMGAPMMAAPHTMMMPGSHPEQCGQMPWGQPVACAGMPVMGHAIAHTTASSAPHMVPRVLSAPVMGTCVAVPAASAAGGGVSAAGGGAAVVAGNASGGTMTPKASGSMATWSHDASAATHLGDMAWAEVDVGVDVFGLGSNAEDLHEFSDSLLQADEGAEAGENDSSQQAKRGGNAGGENLMDEDDEELGAEGLSWMDEDCLMDDLRPLGEQGTFLDVMT